jgi:hypothetical protein
MYTQSRTCLDLLLAYVAVAEAALFCPTMMYFVGGILQFGTGRWAQLLLTLQGNIFDDGEWRS